MDYGSFWDKDDAAFFGKNGELSVKRDYINGLRLFILDFECSTSVHTGMYMYRLEFLANKIPTIWHGQYKN